MRVLAVPVLAASLLSGLLGSCSVLPGGEERTPEAFCETYGEQKDQYLTKYDERAALSDQVGAEDPFAGVIVALGSSIEAIGDLVIVFDHLAGSAPDDIRPDVEAIRDALKKSIDEAGDSLENPLGGLANGLVTGLSTMGSWERVGDYVVEHCGEQA